MLLFYILNCLEIIYWLSLSHAITYQLIFHRFQWTYYWVLGHPQPLYMTLSFLCFYPFVSSYLHPTAASYITFVSSLTSSTVEPGTSCTIAKACFLIFEGRYYKTVNTMGLWEIYVIICKILKLEHLSTKSTKRA